jgi:fibronectin-binding autotransporter adhesin
MFFERWFHPRASDLTNKPPASGRRARPRPFRPRLEALEERLTPSTRTWSGAGGNNLWSTAANWDAAPVAGDDLVFPANAARLSNVNDTAIGRAFGSITFTGSGYSISGNRITLNGNGINAGQLVSGTDTLDLNITLSGSDQPVTVGFSNLSGGVLVLSGLVSGTTGMVKAGPGVLELAGSATNTFSGPLQVNAGTLRLNKSGANAVLGSLVIGDGSGTDSVLLLGDDQIGDNGTVTVNSGGSLNLNNHDDTIGSLTLTAGTVATGTGLLILNGDVTTNAAATASTISGKLSVGGVVARQVTVADGSAASDLIISAALTGALGAGMAKGGAGKMVLSGANDSLTGTMQVDAGVLRITTNTALGIAGSAGTTVASGGTLEVAGGLTLPEALSLDGAGGLGALFIPADGGSNTWSGPITLGGDATIRSDTSSFDFTKQQTISGAIGGSGGLIKTGPGRIQLTSANNYGGVTTVSQGALIMGNAQALGSSAATAGTTVQAGAALETTFNGTSNEVLTLNGNGVPNAFGGTSGALFANTSVTFAGAVTLASDSKVGSNADGAALTLSGGIGGPGGLTVVGLVAFTGSAPNSYAGNTQVGDGSAGDNILTLNKSPNTNAIPGGALIINGSVTVASSEQIPDTVPITGGSLVVNAPETIGPLTLTSGFLFGSATVTLAGDVTVNGFSSFLNGNVSVASATRTITVNAGGRLDVTSLTGGATGSLIKAGPGFLNLKGPAGYGGTTTVNAGLLTAGAAVSGPAAVNSGTTLAGVGPLVNVNVAGGTLDPGLEIPGGDAVGVLRAGGTVTLNSTATLHVDLRGPTPGVNNGHDQFNLTGTGTGARMSIARASCTNTPRSPTNCGPTSATVKS